LEPLRAIRSHRFLGNLQSYYDAGQHRHNKPLRGTCTRLGAAASTTIGQSWGSDENTHKYGLVPTVDRDRLLSTVCSSGDLAHQFSGLTCPRDALRKAIALGQCKSHYTRVTYDGFGEFRSVGNLFQPGT